MLRKPTLVASVLLDGTDESGQVTIPGGVKHVAINPRTTTVDVNVSFIQGQSNTAGSFFQLLDGQSLQLDVEGADEFAGFYLYFFATAAVTVDVLAW